MKKIFFGNIDIGLKWGKIIMTVNRALAIRLSSLLVKHKMSKYRLEKISGMSHSAMVHIFNEDYKDIKLSTCIRFARAFNMTLVDFLNDPIFDNLDLEIE